MAEGSHMGGGAHGIPGRRLGALRHFLWRHVAHLLGGGARPQLARLHDLARDVSPVSSIRRVLYGS